MPRFFVEETGGDAVVILGADARHIFGSLRMRPGEQLTVCDGNSRDCLCEIVSVAPDHAELRVLSRGPCPAEPPAVITLYQSLAKGDKLEWIVQKAAELGAAQVALVLSARCVARPDARATERRLERLNRIALEAAKQCGRGMVPRVLPPVSFRDAVEQMRADDAALFFYELGGQDMAAALTGSPKRVSLMIGPEGGFDADEAALARAAGLSVCTLGPRILRCETAPLCALSVITYLLERK